jgi:nicotinamidase/pyrazinamidase
MAEYDTRTALLVVDVQNDFADPAGSLYVRGGEEVVPVVNREVERATEAGALVVYTQDWHPSHTPHFEQDGGVWPVHCVHDTWGSDFHPQLRVLDAPVIRKGSEGGDGYSAFSVRNPQTAERSSTALERMLREREIERVVIAGLATDYCVKETGLDARRLGFGATVISEAIRAVNLAADDGERALEELRNAGVHVE